jgi:hypothetical protein
MEASTTRPTQADQAIKCLQQGTIILKENHDHYGKHNPKEL